MPLWIGLGVATELDGGGVVALDVNVRVVELDVGSVELDVGSAVRYGVYDSLYVGSAAVYGVYDSSGGEDVNVGGSDGATKLRSTQ